MARKILASDYDVQRRLNSPSAGTVVPSLHDADDEALPFLSLLILDSGVGGNIKYTSIQDVIDTIPIPANLLWVVLPVTIKRIWNTGTTLAASTMRGLL